MRFYAFQFNPMSRDVTFFFFKSSVGQSISDIMPFGNRKGGGLSRKSNVTKRKRDSRLRGDEFTDQQRNFMDLTLLNE